VHNFLKKRHLQHNWKERLAERTRLGEGIKGVKMQRHRAWQVWPGELASSLMVL
jgi:hypothetical protein